jgi:hypothetical protein
MAFGNHGLVLAQIGKDIRGRLNRLFCSRHRFNISLRHARRAQLVACHHTTPRYLLRKRMLHLISFESYYTSRSNMCTPVSVFVGMAERILGWRLNGVKKVAYV